MVITQVWIGYLRQLSRAVVEEKDKSLLFNSAVFDPPEGLKDTDAKSTSPCPFLWCLILTMEWSRLKYSTRPSGQRQKEAPKQASSCVTASPLSGETEQVPCHPVLSTPGHVA